MTQPPEGWEYDPQWMEKWRADMDREAKRRAQMMFWFGVGTHTICYAIGWGMGLWLGLSWVKS